MFHLSDIYFAHVQKEGKLKEVKVIDIFHMLMYPMSLK